MFAADIPLANWNVANWRLLIVASDRRLDAWSLELGDWSSELEACNPPKLWTLRRHWRAGHLRYPHKLVRKQQSPCLVRPA